MTTIVNNPPPTNDSNGLTGIVLLLIVLLVLGYLGFMYGLPALRQLRIGTPQINVPNEIDVNVNQSE